MATPAMVCAMVNEGWDFATLMRFSAREFMGWYQAQAELNEARAKAARKPAK